MQQPISSTTLSSWVIRINNSHRCLWAIDRHTRALTWKRREDYSCISDVTRLKTVFEAMEASFQNAALSSPADVANLFKLRSRVRKKYDRYQAAHCWFYRWIFAYGLDAAYQRLMLRIDHALYAGLRGASETPTLRSKDQELLFSQLSREGNGEVENRMLANFLEKYPPFLDRLPSERRPPVPPPLPSRSPSPPVLLQDQVDVEVAVESEAEGEVVEKVKEITFEYVLDNPESLPSLDPAVVVKHLAALPLSHFPYLSKPQVVAILPHINDLIFGDQCAKDSINWNDFLMGPKRLIAIGIAKLHEFNLLDQIDLGIFDDDQLRQFIGKRGDLLCHFKRLEDELYRISADELYRLEDPFLQQRIDDLKVPQIKAIGVHRFTIPQLLKKDPSLLLDIDRAKLWEIDVNTLTVPQLAVLFDALNIQRQIHFIDFSRLSPQDVETILGNDVEKRIKKLESFVVAQNFGTKFKKEWLAFLTPDQRVNLVHYLVSKPKDSSTPSDDSSQ